MAILTPRDFISKKGRKFIFRNLVSTEAESLNSFMEQIGQETQNTLQYPGYHRFTIEEQSNRIQKFQDHPVDLILGVFSDQKLIGALIFFKGYGNHPWYLHHAGFGMMILEEHWGDGLGKELLKIMEEHARLHEITRIAAEVRTFNERGVHFYKNAGFKIEGTRKKAALINGKMTDEYYIAKLLDEKFPRWTPPTLTTDRLILRAITLEDAPAMFEYSKNPNVARYTTWEPKMSVQESLDGIKNYFFPKYDNQEPEAFAICLKTNPSEMLGTVGTWWDSKRSQCMEMGYALSEEYWNKGIITEAANEVIRYCFEEYSRDVSPVNRVQAHCKLENVASARVMEKIGMQYEAIHRQRVFNKNRFWDMKVYAILKEDRLKP